MKDTLDVLLIALDDHKSLHKAAGAIAMTQSAASKELAELESMLEAPLFEPAKTGLIPNPFGRCVVRLCARARRAFQFALSGSRVRKSRRFARARAGG